jgi:hypothetical protein
MWFIDEIMTSNRKAILSCALFFINPTSTAMVLKLGDPRWVTGNCQSCDTIPSQCSSEYNNVKGWASFMWYLSKEVMLLYFLGTKLIS